MEAYEPSEYWKERHSTYGMSMKGSGHKGKSEDQNIKDYDKAANIIRKKYGKYFKDAHQLDIGCGNGYYIPTFLNLNIKTYSGIDITDVLFDNLKNKFPSLVFAKIDICKELPTYVGKFDIITMIDVTQHIVDDYLFKFAMENIKQLLKPKASFIVTSWCEDQGKRTHYEYARDISAYKNIFKGYKFSKPVKFRDKWIFRVWKK